MHALVYKFGLCFRRSAMKSIIVFFACLLFVASAVLAGEADVETVNVTRTGEGVYRFDVTVRHADEGWKHYADKWDIVAPNGSVLGTRTLYHPHVDEQPFTRSLSGVKIPAGVQEITVRAHDSVHEYGGKMIAVEIP